MTDGFGRFTQIFQPQEILLDEQGMPVQTGLMGMNPTLLGLATGLLEAGAPTVGAPTPVSTGLSRGLTNAMAFQQAVNQQAMQAAQAQRQQRVLEIKQAEEDRQRNAMTQLDVALEGSGLSEQQKALARAFPGEFAEANFRKPVQRTAAVRNLLAAGLEEGTPEFQEALLRIQTKPLATVNMPPEAKRETKTQEEMGKRDVRIYDTMQSEADRAQESNLYVARSLQLMDEMETGALTPTTSMVRSLADAIGIEVDAERLGAEQAYRQVNTRFVLDQIAGMKGAISDREFATLSAAAPGLARSPAGNRFMLNMIRELNNRKIELANLQSEYFDREGKLGVGWDKFRRQWVKENPMFTDDLRAEMEEARKGRFQTVGENREMPSRERQAPASIGGRPTQPNDVVEDTATGQRWIVQQGASGLIMVPVRE